LAVRELIVNADELGLTEGVNHGIVKVHRQGIVTSTTMVANVVTEDLAFDHAVALARAMPTLAIGVHLNVTYGHPVLPEVRVFSLVDEDGLFYRRNRFIQRIAAGQIELVQVEDEFRAQIDRVIEAGILPSHLDSHESIHMYPALFPIVAGLAREYRLPVRLQDEPMAREAFANLGTYLGYVASGSFMKNHVMKTLSRRYRVMLRDWGIPTSDNFLSTFNCLRKDPNSLERSLTRELENLRPGVTELMVHPGFSDSSLEQQLDGGHQAAMLREEEVRILTDHRLRDLLDRNEVRLIDYRALLAVPA
jgi:predicted glycoside hydrolase/deacetylase ChbG (UPF0249 family)